MISAKSIRQFFLLVVVFTIPYPEVFLFGNPYLFLPMAAFLGYLAFAMPKLRELLTLRYVRPVILPMALLFALMVIINIVNYVPGSMNIAISFMQRMVIYTLFFVLCVNEMLFDPTLQNRLKLSLILSMIFSLVLLNTGIGITFRDERAYIFGTNPNLTATLAVVSIFWIIGFVSARMNLFKKAFYVLVAVGLLAMIVQSGSRGAVVFLFIGLVLYYLFLKKTLSFKLALLVPFLLAGFLAFSYIINSDVYQKRINEEERRKDLGGRLYIWEFSWDIFKENMLFGVGPANFQVRIEQHFGKYKTTHNEYLLILCYSGLIGFTCFFVFLFRIGRQLAKVFLRQKDLSISILAVIFATVLFNLFKGGGVLMTFYTWFLLAFITGTAKQAEIMGIKRIYAMRLRHLQQRVVPKNENPLPN